MNRIITLVLALSVLMSMMNVAFATERLDGDMDLSEGAEVYVQTEEDRILLMDKLANMPSTRSYVEGTYNVIGVPVFEQEEDWYCAPARLSACPAAHHCGCGPYCKGPCTDCPDSRV